MNENELKAKIFEIMIAIDTMSVEKNYKGLRKLHYSNMDWIKNVGLSDEYYKSFLESNTKKLNILYFLTVRTKGRFMSKKEIEQFAVGFPYPTDWVEIVLKGCSFDKSKAQEILSDYNTTLKFIQSSGAKGVRKQNVLTFGRQGVWWQDSSRLFDAACPCFGFVCFSSCGNLHGLNGCK